MGDPQTKPAGAARTALRGRDGQHVEQAVSQVPGVRPVAALQGQEIERNEEVRHVTEVNEQPDQHHPHDNHADNGRGEVAPVAPSIPALLVCTADVIMTGLPDPLMVEVSARYGLDVEVATHADLARWAQTLGLARWPWSSQPYVSGGTLCQLTNLYGRWQQAKVRLHTLEPVDALPALRGEVTP